MGINEQDLREYIVTLYRHEDLELFYDDMETPGGNLYIPNRAVPVHLRRDLSCNTHYYLTDQEAAALRQDPRVWAVELPIKDRGFRIELHWSQTSNSWYKGEDSTVAPGTLTSADKNWALLRCTEGVARPNWGYDANPRATGTATTDADGANVDVVICDGLFRNTHAEFYSNDTGGGVNRAQQINWFQYSAAMGKVTASVYNYGTVNTNTGEGDHGAHVAGVVAGYTQGWAKRANIYNINPFGTNSLPSEEVFDYILYWHLNKAVNPATGQRNPTVVNCSFGTSYYLLVSEINRIQYRGQEHRGPWTNTGNGTVTFEQVGIYDGAKQYFLKTEGDRGFYIRLPAATEYWQSDVDTLTAAGIHIVCAAGNWGMVQDVPGGPDYNNAVVTNKLVWRYYNRLGGPQTSKSINVGNARSEVLPTIHTSSMRGPGVDIFAPGTGIVSAISRTASTVGGVLDPRFRNGDRIDSYNGTSMASPQVAGVIACLLEKNPSTTPAAMKSQIIAAAKLNQLSSPTGALAYPYNLAGAANRFLFYPTSTSTTSSTSTTTQGTTSTTSTTTTTTTTMGPYFSLTIVPGTTINEGDTAEICLEVNKDLTANGTEIPITIQVTPI